MRLGLHQVAVTALFAWLDRARTCVADRVLAPFLGGVAAIIAVIPFVAQPLLVRFGFAALKSDGIVVFAAVLPILGVQVFFWIAFAMLQMRINRVGLAA